MSFSRKGLIPQFIPQVLAPNLRGARFNLSQDQNGAFIVEVNDQAVKMEPKQAYDLGKTIFMCLGIEEHKIPPAPGTPGSPMIRAV